MISLMFYSLLDSINNVRGTQIWQQAGPKKKKLMKLTEKQVDAFMLHYFAKTG